MLGVESDSDRGNESESKESENWKVGRSCISMWDKSINRSLPLVLLQAQLPFSHCDENPCSSLTAPWTPFFFLFSRFLFLFCPRQTRLITSWSIARRKLWGGEVKLVWIWYEGCNGKREKKKLKEQHIINGSTNIKVQGENEAIEVEV